MVTLGYCRSLGKIHCRHYHLAEKRKQEFAAVQSVNSLSFFPPLLPCASPCNTDTGGVLDARVQISSCFSEGRAHSFFFRSCNFLLSGYIHFFETPCSIALADHADNRIAWLLVSFGLKSRHVQLRIHRANSPLRPQFIGTLPISSLIYWNIHLFSFSSILALSCLPTLAVWSDWGLQASSADQITSLVS